MIIGYLDPWGNEGQDNHGKKKRMKDSNDNKTYSQQ